MTSKYSNPIIPGFYPDPSCILVGDNFYLVNSSFQFFPGIPIHKSKDLVNWEHIGNAICRPEQMCLDWATTKINNAAKHEIFTGGIYAPTIRHHNGRFYIICTFLRGTIDMPADVDFAPENFIITSTNLEDPSSFSDLISFDFHGIDPSLFFDDDGRAYMQGSWIHGYRKNPATVIRQAEIDVQTGQLLSPPRDIWTGFTGKVPEGPHIYKKDNYYYLLIAEGGTHRNHKITMSRSRHIWGPYESFGGNPVLTASDPQHPIQCVGHGELFQDLAGEWWAVMLARRELGSCFPLGRETYMTPVEWPENEFPTLAPVELEQECNRNMVGKTTRESTALVSLASPLTLYLRTPDLKNYTQVEDRITLTPVAACLGAASGSPTFVGQRQVSLESTAQVSLDLKDFPRGGVSCGLTVYKDTFRYVVLEYDALSGKLYLKRQRPGQPLDSLAQVDTRHFISVILSIRSSPTMYAFTCTGTFSNGNIEEKELGSLSATELSGDDFTGTTFGIFASGCEEESVTFQDFRISCYA